MVGFANTTARDMIDHLFLSYDSITAVNLEQNWEHMCKAWDPHQPVESLFKQIHDFVDYSEAGGITISEAKTLQTAYTKIFATVIFHSDCHHWNDRLPAEQTWNAFKTHFTMAYRQHKQMQGGKASASGYANTSVAQPDDEDLAGAAIDASANLATATAVDRDIVATLAEANSHLTKKLEDNSQNLKEIKALLKRERSERSFRKTFAPPNNNYCWTHG
jgi:hypothetical protein